MSVLAQTQPLLPAPPARQWTLDTDAAWRSGSQKGPINRFFKARSARAVVAKPLEARPLKFITTMRALMGILSTANAPHLDDKATSALYAFLSDPSDKTQLEALIRQAMNDQPTSASFDIDHTIDLMGNVSLELRRWKRQIIELSKIQCLQLHDQLKTHAFQSPGFNTLIQDHLASVKAHLQAIVGLVASAVIQPPTQNNNAKAIFDHLTRDFANAQQHTLFNFLYNRKFGTSSKKAMAYFASRNDIPTAVLVKASVAMDRKRAQVKGAPELYLSGTDHIHAKKEELKQKKDELQAKIADHQALFAKQRDLLNEQQFDPSTDKTAELTQKEQERKQIERDIPKLKMECEALEYDVQMMRLDFTKSNAGLINEALKKYYHTQVEPIASQNPTNFQYHYDVKTLVMYNVAKFATQLGIDEAIAQSDFLHSEYMDQLALDDTKVKEQMSISSLPTHTADKKAHKKRLKELEKRKFYLPGTNQYVQGMAEAYDLYIACNHVANDPLHQDTLVITQAKLFDHLVNMKTDEYVATAMLDGKGNQKRLKKSVSDQFGSDVQALKVVDSLEKAPCLMMERLRKKAAHPERDETVSLSSTQGLIEACTQAKQQAVIRIKKLMAEKSNAKSLHNHDQGREITSSSVLNDIMARHPGSIGQFDQVLEHYRARQGVAITSAISRPMGPDGIAPGGDMHLKHAPYYGQLKLDQLVRFFNPLITAEEEAQETVRITSEFQQIAIASVLEETAVDYADDNPAYAHTTLPPALSQIDVYQSSQDLARMKIADQLCARFDNKPALAQFPYLQKIHEKNPSFFVGFGSKVKSTQNKLKQVLREMKAASSSQRIASVKKHLALTTRELTRHVLDSTFDTQSNIGFNALSPALFQTVEELTYFIESVHAPLLHDAIENLDIAKSEVKALALLIQTTIKQGIVDHVLNISVEPAHGRQSMPFFVKNLVSMPASIAEMAPSRDELIAPFVVSFFQQTKQETYQETHKLAFSKLFANDQARHIDSDFIKDVIHEPALSGMPPSAHLSTIQSSFRLYQEGLELATVDLTHNIARLNAQYAPLAHAIKKLKEATPAQSQALDAEMLRIKIAALKRDFLTYEQIVNTDTSVTAWKDYYETSIAITSQLMVYKKLGDDAINTEIANLMIKANTKKNQLQADNPATFDQEWASVLNRALPLINTLVTINEPAGEDDASGEIHPRSLAKLNTLLALNTPSLSLLQRIRAALPFG